jgi:putative phosphoesterase
LRIGVISDTHNHLPNVARIVALLGAAGVERVIHTGDITQPKTLRALAELTVPVFGVYGNNDLERPGLEAAASVHGMMLADPPLELFWAERRIVVVHDPRAIEHAALASGDVALHGHTHRLCRDTRGGALVFNPGECAGHMKGHNAVGIVDLRTLRTELLHF